MATDKPQSSPKTLAKSTAENIKDTLESIVVAFILAFVFRAFIVEAFVIPTGSMAPTLYGNEATTTCSVCGFEYARGIDATEEQYAPHIDLHCPNCETRSDRIERPQIANPCSGDRILVYKWPFDTRIDRLGPHRWEVTVFKDPYDGTTNFIKRLVGLPDEVLEIIDGDVYRASLDELRAVGFPLDKMDQLRQDIYAVGHGQHMLQADIEDRYRELNKLLLPHLKIQRKLLQSPRAQQALWVNVYNHDYLPNYALLAGPGEETQPDGRRARVGWYAEDPAAEAAWSASKTDHMIAQREISFRSSSPTPLFIRFDGKGINNFAAYNQELNRTQWSPVGDVRLRFTWFPTAGNGSIVLQMNRDLDTFIAEIGADGTVTLTGKQPRIPGGQQILGTRKLEAFTPGQAVEVEFVNVDYLVRLSVGGETVIESNDSQYAPDPIAKLEKKLPDTRQVNSYQVKETQIRIGAHDLDCRLRHVVLERDAYYTDVKLGNERDKPPNPYDDWSGWGTAGHPIMLRPERTVNGVTFPAEYFMMGDNSPASKDSRLWWEIGPHLVHLGAEYQVGTATGDQLIGKAFFVYWPAAYRRPWAGDYGFIPNVGQMRWIR